MLFTVNGVGFVNTFIVLSTYRNYLLYQKYGEQIFKRECGAEIFKTGDIFNPEEEGR